MSPTPTPVPSDVLQYFNIEPKDLQVSILQQGLINRTWKLSNAHGNFIVQRINDQVFKSPHDVAHNIASIGKYLSAHFPQYIFTMPISAADGNSMYTTTDNSFYRAFHYIDGSHSYNSVQTAAQAYEAAAQFAGFTARLSRFDVSDLRITIPSFHNLSLRYEQFLSALSHGNPERIRQAAEWIQKLKQYAYINEQYLAITKNPEFKIRVTHHDTKISNVLFDPCNKGLCVIDLDTVMPGYFISDVGDMMRTYLCPVTEEEKDLGKISVRKDVYHAIVNGYLSQMDKELSRTEKQHFFYAGCFMIYMQALRFATDFLNNDIYYGAQYPNHNLVRAANQCTLLEQYVMLKEELNKEMPG